MKKVLLILVAVIGISSSVFAQKKTAKTTASQAKQTAAVAVQPQETQAPQETVAVSVAPAPVKQEPKNYVYCQLAGRKKPFTTKIQVSVDYGEKRRTGMSFDIGSGGAGNGDFITGENGKRIKFNSMIDAMNYMGAQGWEFVQAFVVVVRNQQETVYVLKKEITPEEKAKMETDLKSEK